MAETDESQKTEEPTQKKLDDAHQQGQVAKSQEVRHWFMLAGMLLSVALFAASGARELSVLLSGILSRMADIPAGDPGYLISMTGGLLWELLAILGLPFLILMAAGVAGNMVQHKPVWTAEKIKPKASTISPLAGLKRLFSMQSIAEFLKSLLKIVVVTAVVLMLVWPERARLAEVVSYDPVDLLSLVFSLSLRMMVGVLAVMALIAGADFMFQRFQFAKQQRMSKQEVRDEHKQLEGDPTVKARLRQIRQERARKRMMAAVPDATVVITNPTHYAVALKYVSGEMEAPVVVAKGVEATALRIRERAEEHEVPIVENPPLARALYASVEIDQPISPDHYKAVAEVIGFVLKLSRKAGQKSR